MRRYRSGGTPWTVIIDKKGVVRFNGFRVQVKQGEELLNMLINEPMYELLPKERGGQELVGTKLKEPVFGKFSSPLTLYRWWTDTCPFCESSLPALDSLREKYGERGLRVIGDDDWSQLKKWWLETGKRSATSVSFLVDSEGIVRFVHPGPVLFPSEEKKFAQENNDFQLLDRAIDTLLPPFVRKEKTDE
jgi:thiol-disulfide isomerase/thioredoxin